MTAENKESKPSVFESIWRRFIKQNDRTEVLTITPEPATEVVEEVKTATNSPATFKTNSDGSTSPEMDNNAVLVYFTKGSRTAWMAYGDVHSVVVDEGSGDLFIYRAGENETLHLSARIQSSVWEHYVHKSGPEAVESNKE